MKLIAKQYALATILALPIEEQDRIGAEFVRQNGRLKDVRDDQKEAAKVVGKYLLAVELRLETGRKPTFAEGPGSRLTTHTPAFAWEKVGGKKRVSDDAHRVISLARGVSLNRLAAAIPPGKTTEWSAAEERATAPVALETAAG